MERDTRRLALVSVCLGILVVTLLPERAGLSGGFRGAALHQALASLLENVHLFDILDLVQNVLLFLPLGVLLACAPGADRPVRQTLASAAVAGLILSGMVECAQAWIPGRFPSLLDVALNAAGAGLGAWAALRFRTGAPVAVNQPDE